MDRDTPHQSEHSRSDTSQVDGYASSSTTRGDDDGGNTLFDNDNDDYTPTPPATNTPLLRNSTLNTQNHAATVGSMGAQFITAVAAGAGEGTGEDVEEESLAAQPMLEHVVLLPADVAGGVVGELRIVDTVRRHRGDMDRERMERYSPVSAVG